MEIVLKAFLLVILILIALFIGTALGWRALSRRWSLPCPSWLGGSKYEENRYVRAVADASLLLRRAQVADGMRLLDVGCGWGRLTIPAAKRVGPNGQVVAFDIQLAMLLLPLAASAATSEIVKAQVVC